MRPAVNGALNTDRDHSCALSRATPGRTQASSLLPEAAPSPDMSSHAQNSTEEVVSSGLRWRQIEQEWKAQGARIPLSHSLAWAEDGPDGKHLLLVVRKGGWLLGGVAVRVQPSRALPGHVFLKVNHFGGTLEQDAVEPILCALARLARENPRVLRASVRVFSRDSRSQIAAVLRRCGYRQPKHALSYRHTLTIDLSHDEQTIFRGLHKTARKNLRQAWQASAQATTLIDARYAARLAQLESASMARTGRSGASLEWGTILRLSELHPEASRICGVFLPQDGTSPEALVAFAWGTMQGDHGTYSAAGTLRIPHSKVPLSYPLLWDLMIWSKSQGASWFDVGGVTLEDTPGDRLQGISKFKRYFSQTMEEVGEEWILEPHPIRASVAQIAGLALRTVAAAVPRRIMPAFQAPHSNLKSEP